MQLGKRDCLGIGYTVHISVLLLVLNPKELQGNNTHFHVNNCAGSLTCKSNVLFLYRLPPSSFILVFKCASVFLCVCFPPTKQTNKKKTAVILQPTWIGVYLFHIQPSHRLSPLIAVLVFLHWQVWCAVSFTCWVKDLIHTVLPAHMQAHWNIIQNKHIHSQAGRLGMT